VKTLRKLSGLAVCVLAGVGRLGSQEDGAHGRSIFKDLKENKILDADCSVVMVFQQLSFLEEAGLVEVGPDPKPGKYRWYKPTALGENILEYLGGRTGEE